MNQPQPILALDVGTTKVCALIGADHGGEIHIVGLGLAPSPGMRQGVVVDLQETTRAIREAVSRAQQMAGLRPESAWVGVTGEHIACMNTRAAVAVSHQDHLITEETIARLHQAANHNAALGPDRVLLHSVPRGYLVDGQRGVRRPEGMSASKLEVETHLVTGSRNFIENVDKCVEAAGVSVQEFVFEPLASARALLTPEEEDLGVAVLDIGGGTTDLAVFVSGSVCHTGAVPVAGNHITRDLAVGLQVSLEEAEQLKVQQGCALVVDMDTDDLIEIGTIGTDEKRELPRRVLAEIIEPRVQEIFQLVRREIDRSGFGGHIASGVVLTGGGSQLPSIQPLARATLGCTVRLGQVSNVGGVTTAVRSPIYATSVGLLRYAAEHARGRPEPAPGLGRLSAWWDWLTRRIGRFFRG